MQSMATYRELVEKYALDYDDWTPELEEQREWDRKLKAGEIE